MGHGQQGENGGYRSSIAAIKQCDPHANEIIDGSYRVAIFTLNDETNVWIRTFPDASVLVYSRNVEPKYVLFTDYSVDRLEMALLTAEKKFQIDGPFLFYKNELDCIRCYRFQTEDDCSRVGKLIQQIMEPTIPLSLQQATRYGGILSMLATAQDVFDNSTQLSQVNNGISFDAASNPIKSASKKRTLSEQVRVDRIDKRQRTLPDTVSETQSSSDHSLLASLTKHSTQETESSLTATESLSSKFPTQTKPQLCSPLMFTATKKLPKETSPSTLLVTTTEVNGDNRSVAREKPEPLTQNQLLQAVSHLMKTDKGFVHKLHEAYLHSFVEMLPKLH